MAKKKTPEQQALEREVKKQRKRIQQFVRRAQKRGFSFPENIVPTLPKKITEKTLSRYKAMTPEQLYKKSVYTDYQGTFLESKAVTIKGTERRKQERHIAAVRAAQTRQRYYEARMRMEREVAAISPSDYKDYIYTDNYFITSDEESQQGYGPAPTPQSKLVLNQLRDMIASWSPRDIWSISLTELKRKDVNLLSSTFEGIIAREGEDSVARRCEENAEILVALAERIMYDSGDSYKTRGVDGVNQDIQHFAEIVMGRSMTVRESMEFTEYGEQTGVYE